MLLIVGVAEKTDVQTKEPDR